MAGAFPEHPVGSDDMLKLIIFGIVSAGFISVSWASLRNPRLHGFFRFFAFESILVLILLNMEHWFSDPFSVLQVVSWLLLISSLILAVHGFYLLRIIGKPKHPIENSTTLAFENTTTLVMLGAYKYIRHPLYASLLCLGWGVFFKDPSLLSSMVVLVASTFLIATAKAEETENIQRFGENYALYMKATKMFIPFLF